MRAGIIVLFSGLFISLIVSGCGVRPKGNSVEEKQEFVVEETNAILNQLYEADPSKKQEVEASYGIAVFSYRTVKLPIFPLLGFGAGSGFGVLYDYMTNEQQFMKVSKGEWGWGLGVNALGLVVVFNTREALEKFKSGQLKFETGAQADIKPAGYGASARGAVGQDSGGMTVYTLSKSGVSYGITVRYLNYRTDRALK